MQPTDPTAIPSRAVEYGLFGVFVTFCASFPLALFVLGPGLGVRMDAWTAFLFALCASSVFGFVAGAVAGAAEPARNHRMEPAVATTASVAANAPRAALEQAA